MPYSLAQLGTFGLGQVVLITATFSVSGVAADPSNVFLELTTPAGVTTTYTYNTSGTWTHTGGSGIYAFQIVPTVPGIYTGRFYSTGTGQVSQDFTFSATVSSNYP